MRTNYYYWSSNLNDDDDFYNKGSRGWAGYSVEKKSQKNNFDDFDFDDNKGNKRHNKYSSVQRKVYINGKEVDPDEYDEYVRNKGSGNSGNIWSFSGFGNTNKFTDFSNFFNDDDEEDQNKDKRTTKNKTNNNKTSNQNGYSKKYNDIFNDMINNFNNFNNDFYNNINKNKGNSRGDANENKKTKGNSYEDSPTAPKKSDKNTENQRKNEQNAAAGNVNFSQFAVECLNQHNEYRRRHHVCDLKLNQELCGIAENYARYIASIDTLQHSDNTYNDDPLGENLYYEYGYSFSGKNAVKSWYSEKSKYDFSGDSDSGSAGHFTQLVWKDSKELGVGYAKSRDGGVYVVCNYYPAGNYLGDFAANVFRE